MVQRHGSETIGADARRPSAGWAPDEVHGEAHERHEAKRHGKHGPRAEHAEQIDGRAHDQRAPDPNGKAPVDGERVVAAGDQEAPAVDRVAELAAALEAVKAEAAENWDKFLRERAETENYKRRLERTHAEQVKRVRKEMLLKTLGALDNFERALAYEGQDASQVDPQSLLMGLKMTLSQFKDLLAAEGVTEVLAAGERFDPALHEAVATEVAPDVPEGQIVAELQKGYRIGDELLRPARVKVATRA